MKITINKSYRKFKEGDVFDFSDLKKLKTITVVGNNGSGKSSLVQTIRGHKHSLDEISLYANEYKILAMNATIESDYKKIFIYDSIKDDGNNMNVSFDAVNFFASGGFAIKDKSHGESSLINIHRFTSDIEKKIIKDETLVILDEIDKGLSLKLQANFINVIYKLVKLGCHVMVITHNVFTIRDSHIVYDLEKKDWINSADYIKELTGFEFKRVSK